MTCYKPLHGYFSKRRNSNGKRDVTFNKSEAFTDMPVEIACGRCIGCRLEKSRQWAVRCVHESQTNKHNSFLTLTYDNKNLPKDHNIDKTHIQKFIKRLRKKFDKKKLSYMYCGEYGEDLGRPHYHICLFGIDFHQDRKIYRTTNQDHKLYNSKILDKLWPYGHAVIGDLTYQSAAYVARYVTKKINGKDKEDHYGQKIDTQSGEITLLRTPEFAEASRRPALGRDWFFKNYKQVYPNDFVVVNKKKQKPPRYYDQLLEKYYPDLYTKVKYNRIQAMKLDKEKNPYEHETYRKLAKEENRQRKAVRLKRSLTNESIYY